MYPDDYLFPPATSEPAPFAPDADEEPPAKALAPDDPAFHVFDRFGELCAKRSQLKSELEEVEDQMHRLEPPIRSWYATHPRIGNIPSHGFTIFVKTEIWVRPKPTSSKQEVCDVLRTTGLGHYVRDDYSTSGLSAHVRALEKTHAGKIRDGEINDVSELLPAPLAKVLNINPKVTVQGRKSSKAERND